MATFVPRVSGTTVDVEPLPQVRQTAEADFSGVVAQGRALQQLAGVGFDLARRIQDKNDTAAVMAARRKLSDWEASTFDPENPEGIGKFRGGKALGADEALIGDLDRQLSTITETMSARQREKFAGVAEGFRDSVRGRVLTHMDREHSGFLEAEQAAAVDNLSRDAIMAGVSGDFALQDQRANELIAMNRAKLEADGAGAEVIRQQTETLASIIRTRTIEGMMSSSPYDAQGYFEKHRDQLTPADRLRIEGMLEPIVNDAEADRLASSIMSGETTSQYRDPGQRGRPSPEIKAILDQEADAAGVPREFLYAIAEQESSFNPKAVGTVLDDGDRATGLFQYRATSSKGFDRTDPRQSARAAAREFAERTKRQGVEYAIAAHFAGDGGADAVVLRGRTAENPKTAQYVREVMGRASRWRGGATEGEVIEGRGMAPGTEADALERAARIRDPRLRAATQQKIRERYNLADMRRQEQERQLSESIYVAINRADNPGRPLRELIGAEAYAYAEKKGQIQSLEAIRRNKIAGTLVQDDIVLVDQLRREAVLNPEAFRRRDLYSMADRMSTSTLGDIIGMQKSANDPAKRVDWADTQARIDSGLRILGLDEASDPDNRGKVRDRKTQRAQFAELYQSYERDYVQQNGKKPTREAADVLLRSLVRRVAEDPDKVLRSTARIEGYNAAMSTAERDAIIRAYRARVGRDPSDAEIVRIATRANQGEAQQ
jgi:soluble lytic murein transglycosylase-like protein